MRQVSQLYKTLRNQTGSYYEVRIVREPSGDSKVYGMDELKSITIDQALFQGSGPSIGGVNSTQCTAKIVEQSTNWPRAAEFEVQIRLTDDEQYSEWLSMGTYYTDERRIDKYGNLEIIGFDKMLLLEQSWTDKVENLPESWPITVHDAAELLEEATDIEIDERTQLDNSVPCIGLNTRSTAREVYASIAAIMGGNWTITPEGKLHLVRLWNYQPGSSAIAGIAIAGLAIVGSTDPAIEGGDVGYVVLGQNVVDLETNEGLPGITNVILETESGTTAQKILGEGYTLQAQCEFSNSDAVDVCLSRLFGYSYTPFTATGARLDPVAEIGDEVEIDGGRYTINTIKWKIGPHITADISAPFEETIDHEYKMPSESAKALRKAVGYTEGQIQLVNSYITQTERSIREGVAASYVKNQALEQALANYSPTEEIANNYYNKEESDSKADALSSEIVLTESRFQVAFNEFRAETDDAINAISYYIRYENGVVIVGKTDSPTSIRISNDEIALFYGDEKMSYWNQNMQFTPKQLQIPTGGKFTLGDILFQPRTSGNMSLMWVGTGGE